MKFLSIIFLVLLLMTNAYAEELKAELVLVSPPSLLKEGEIVEGILRVWPIENPDLGEFKKLENMTLANSLYITEVEEALVSVNNSEVVETKLLIIIKRSKEADNSPFIYQGQSLNIQFPSLNLAPAEKPSEDYYVLEQSLVYSKWEIIIISVLVLALLLAAFLKRKTIQNFVNKFKKNPEAILKQKISNKFSSAKNREDYESLYSIRLDWIAFFPGTLPSIEEFFRVMEEHQYKQKWSDDNISEVKNSFDAVIRSLK